VEVPEAQLTGRVLDCDVWEEDEGGAVVFIGTAVITGGLVPAVNGRDVRFGIWLQSTDCAAPWIFGSEKTNAARLA
jgi:hypothetical protein